MPNPLEQRVEALERKTADLDAMLESLLARAALERRCGQTRRRQYNGGAP